MNDWILVLIVALLPITALFTVVQKQPYYALLSRGIMGMVAVMLYAVLGAADVALTEALVGTLLTVILFAITVRSSLAMRVGIVEGENKAPREGLLRTFCVKQRLYLRWHTYPAEQELTEALKSGRVDAIYARSSTLPSLHRFLGEQEDKNQPITILAEHCQWHERKMKEQFPKDAVIRLTLRERMGAR